MKSHFAIAVIDLDKSIKFYQKLGFKLLGKWQHPEHQLHGVNMDRKDLFLELIHHADNNQYSYPDNLISLHIAVEVDNI